ncbi:hypothetical protein [Nonomuraea jabiensis]|uniref:hypothetical protein n=1 Tax=Nonomuraea jabiensis TaxID=882448 RepID=UPI0036BE4224
MSWPEAPRSAQQDPAWPEPPRTDDSWPEPPRRARPEPARSEAGGPQSWPDLPPQGATGPSWPAPPARDATAPSWPEPSPQGASGPSSSWPDVPPPSAGGPSSWPDSPPRSAGPSSWEASPQSAPTAWPDAAPENGPSSWSGSPAQNGSSSWSDSPQQNGPSSWPDAAPQGGPSSWPDAAPQGGRSTRSDLPLPGGSSPLPGGPSSWADGPQQGSAGPTSWPETPAWGGSEFGSRGEDRPVPDPIPAWEQPPTPSSGSWSNLSSPAPWPPADRDKAGSPEQATAMYQVDDLPQGAHAPPPQAHPSEERTMTYAQHTENLLNDRAVPSPTMDSSNISATPPAEDTDASRPGSNLNRDPSDPDRPFVTAGQISGSRTPPPERQQELWNTVFGDNYEAMDDQDSLEEESQGKPIWIYALGGSVAIALVAALLWAFLAGPLAGDDPAASNAVAEKPTTAQKPSATRSSTTIGALPKYPGKAAPVIGRVPDAAAGISLPRLGGTWRLDTRTTVKATYNYDTRQYVPITQDKSAQLMSGPLPQKLASYYEKDNLEPVIKQVVLDARKRFFPTGNSVRKIAQQPIKVGDNTGRLIAYSLTSETEKATIVAMALNTGGNLPAIVYMSIPAESRQQLMPDVRTVMNQLRIGAQG